MARAESRPERELRGARLRSAHCGEARRRNGRSRGSGRRQAPGATGLAAALGSPAGNVKAAPRRRRPWSSLLFSGMEG